MYSEVQESSTSHRYISQETLSSVPLQLWIRVFHVHSHSMARLVLLRKNDYLKTIFRFLELSLILFIFKKEKQNKKENPM